MVFEREEIKSVKNSTFFEQTAMTQETIKEETDIKDCIDGYRNIRNKKSTKNGLVDTDSSNGTQETKLLEYQHLKNQNQELKWHNLIQDL